MAHRYKIEKIAYANNIKELEDMFPGGETISISLTEEINSPSQIGFIRKDNGKGK